MKIDLVETEYNGVVITDYLPIEIYDDIFNCRYDVGETAEYLEEILSFAREKHLQADLDKMYAYVPDHAESKYGIYYNEGHFVFPQL